MQEKGQIRKPNIKIFKGKFQYLLNEEEKTASIIQFKSCYDEIYIPYSIYYKLNEYIITSISKKAFILSKVESIEFSEDSEIATIEKDAFLFSTIENFIAPPSLTKICKSAFSDCINLIELDIPENSKLKTIEKDAFVQTSIEHLTIPSNLIDLQKGWCNEMIELTRISVMPKNPRYCCIDEQILIGKSSLESDEYDVLEFFTHNTDTSKIPSFIKIIGPYSFNYSSINSIKISSNVTTISEYAFYTSQIRTIEIPEDSKLKTIKNKAFFESSIESLSIPKSLINLEEGWCSETSHLTKIQVHPDNPRYSMYGDKMIIGKSSIDNDSYDSIIFSSRDIEEVSIPNFITIIDSHSFCSCQQLKEINFPPDSQLQIIGKKAFHFIEKLEKISLPPHLTKIRRSAFKASFNLREIEVPENSELQTIEAKVFQESLIECFSIPKSLINLEEDWCSGISDLIHIRVHPDNPRYSMYGDKMIIGKSSIENVSYDSIIFCSRNIEEVSIPSFIKIIESHSFFFCKHIRKIEFEEKSELQMIKRYAFSNASISKFIVPKHVKLIGKNSFYSCDNLKSLEIPIESELEKIDKYAFQDSSITCLTIPPHLTYIAETAFYCSNIQIIEFVESSNMCYFDLSIFSSSKQALFMAPKSMSDFLYD